METLKDRFGRPITLEKWQQDSLDYLMAALGPVELTDEERRSLVWLAGWDTQTIQNMASIFAKVKKA